MPFIPNGREKTVKIPIQVRTGKLGRLELRREGQYAQTPGFELLPRQRRRRKNPSYM